jgi:hypothetical protein
MPLSGHPNPFGLSNLTSFITIRCIIVISIYIFLRGGVFVYFHLLLMYIFGPSAVISIQALFIGEVL